MIARGGVNRDLVSSVDFLPTLCEAAGVAVPPNVDGVSFLPRMRGERRTPREWLYCWYSPRQQVDLTVREFAFDDKFKLYRTGDLFDLAADPFEKQGTGPGLPARRPRPVPPPPACRPCWTGSRRVPGGTRPRVRGFREGSTGREVWTRREGEEEGAGKGTMSTRARPDRRRIAGPRRLLRRSALRARPLRSLP